MGIVTTQRFRGPATLDHYDVDLSGLLSLFTFKEGWRFFQKRESGYPFLVVEITTTDTDTGGPWLTTHTFQIPDFVWDDKRWVEWIFFQIIPQIEYHERAEAFKIRGWAPFAPEHGPYPSDIYARVKRWDERPDIFDPSTSRWPAPRQGEPVSPAVVQGNQEPQY